MCRQRAGCNAGTAKADGQRAWWQLPRGSSAAFGAKKKKFHTCGGPRRRTALAKAGVGG